MKLDNKTIFFGGKDRNIYQIDLKSNNIIQKIKAHNECITRIKIDSKDQFYSVDNDHVLKVWSRYFTKFFIRYFLWTYK